MPIVLKVGQENSYLGQERFEGISDVLEYLQRGKNLSVRDRNGRWICGGPIVLVDSSDLPELGFKRFPRRLPAYLVMQVDEKVRDRLETSFVIVPWSRVGEIFAQR